MNRHPADLVSLAFGLLFSVIGLVVLANDQLALSWEWLAPTMVIALGAIFIAAGWRRRPAPDEQ
jgi:hypothetical protein